MKTAIMKAAYAPWLSKRKSAAPVISAYTWFAWFKRDVWNTKLSVVGNKYLH